MYGFTLSIVWAAVSLIGYIWHPDIVLQLISIAIAGAYGGKEVFFIKSMYVKDYPSVRNFMRKASVMPLWYDALLWFGISVLYATHDLVLIGIAMGTIMYFSIRYRLKFQRMESLSEEQ